MATVSVLVRSRFPTILARANAGAAAATAKAALDIEAQAKTRAPVDTGNLKNSINATGNGVAWRVDSPADYSVYVEFGTHKMTAQPYFVPAVELVRPWYIQALKQIV